MNSITLVQPYCVCKVFAAACFGRRTAVREETQIQPSYAAGSAVVWGEIERTCSEAGVSG
jgi:hypothetical protein